MTRPRDSQRQRLYAAENLIRSKHGKYGKDYFGGKSRHEKEISITDCQMYVDSILRATWFRRRFPYISHIHVTHGLGARGGGGMIRLGHWARCEAVILHEITHNIISDGYAAHGAEFAGVFIFLVRNVLGADTAKILRYAYKDKKVRTNRKALPAPRNDVPSMTAIKRRIKAVETEKKRLRKQIATSPVKSADSAAMARLLRRMIDAGQFGEAHSGARVAALRTIREIKALPFQP